MIVFISLFMLFGNPIDSHLVFLNHSNYLKFKIKLYIATIVFAFL